MFFRFLEHKYNISVDAASYSDLSEAAIFHDYIVHLRDRELSNNSIRSYARSIKVYLHWCYDNDLCKDYLKGVKLPKYEDTLKLPLYADEVRRIDACFDMTTKKGKRNYCIFHLMLDCGLRRQEVVNLKCGDIVPERNVLHIIDGKNNKSRIVLIPDFLIAAVNDYLKFDARSSGAVFKSLIQGHEFTALSIKMMFQKLKHESDVQRLHPHLLRHTFATSFLVGGGNLEFLRVFMGHYDYTVTRMYSSLAAQCRMLGTDIYRLDPIFFKNGY
jgi:site-specific recombinase XerD